MTNNKYNKNPLIIICSSKSEERIKDIIKEIKNTKYESTFSLRKDGSIDLTNNKK